MNKDMHDLELYLWNFGTIFGLMLTAAAIVNLHLTGYNLIAIFALLWVAGAMIDVCLMVSCAAIVGFKRLRDLGWLSPKLHLRRITCVALCMYAMKMLTLLT
jgi:hypothetical protein